MGLDNFASREPDDPVLNDEKAFEEAGIVLCGGSLKRMK